MQYKPAIDGLRALAVVSVLLFHANDQFLPGGYIGVDAFFVILALGRLVLLREPSALKIAFIYLRPLSI